MLQKVYKSDPKLMEMISHADHKYRRVPLIDMVPALLEHFAVLTGSLYCIYSK